MSADSYQVERYPHGVLVFGGVPASEFTALVAAWERGGLTCVTSPEGSKLWRAEVDGRAAAKAGEDREVAWLLGTDAELSSITLDAEARTATTGQPVDPRTLSPRLRHKLQDELASMAARGEVDRAEAEAFLDGTFRERAV